MFLANPIIGTILSRLLWGSDEITLKHAGGARPVVTAV